MMRILFLFASYVAAAASSSSSTSTGSCVKTDNYSGRQCRDLKTKHQEQTLGRVCVESAKAEAATATGGSHNNNNTMLSLKTVFEVTDPSYKLESARVWIGTSSEEAKSQVPSNPVITKVAARNSRLTSTTFPTNTQMVQRMEEETPNTLQILYHRDDSSDTLSHTCPSCKDQELRVMATAKVVHTDKAPNNDGDNNKQPITIYGYEKDTTSFLSYIIGEMWIVESSITIANEERFDGFPIQMTCNCQAPSGSASGGIAGLLLRGRGRGRGRRRL